MRLLFALIVTTFFLTTHTFAIDSTKVSSETRLAAHFKQVLASGFIKNIFCQAGKKNSGCTITVSTTHCPPSYQPIVLLTLVENKYSTLFFNGYRIDHPVPVDNLMGGYYLAFQNAYANYVALGGLVEDNKPISLRYTILCI